MTYKQFSSWGPKNFPTWTTIFTVFKTYRLNHTPRI